MQEKSLFYKYLNFEGEVRYKEFRITEMLRLEKTSKNEVQQLN